MNIVKSATTALHKAGFQLQKHSPEILAVVGVVGTVAAAVMACKATTKAQDILEETKNDVESVHVCLEKETDEEVYNDDIAKKDLALIYAQTGIKLAKVYAPAVILGTLSIGCMLTSNHILRKRNIALAAAYTAVDKSYKQYRSRVIERFGEEVDKELKYNIKAKEIVEEFVDEKTGEKREVKRTVDTIDRNEYSEYAVFFDEYCEDWKKDPALNKAFLLGVQRFLNEKLQRQGHLFLNEVYDAIGVKRTTAGSVVGWIYDEKNPNGDNFVDFKIFNFHRAANRDFVNGYEPSILLDFNVDGVIYDKIELHTY